MNQPVELVKPNKIYNLKTTNTKLLIDTFDKLKPNLSVDLTDVNELEYLIECVDSATLKATQNSTKQIYNKNANTQPWYTYKLTVNSRMREIHSQKFPLLNI